MRINQDTDYALRMVYAFSNLEPGTYMGIARLAELAAISQEMAATILGKLEAAGILVAPPMAGGGYRLSRPKHEITLNDVIEAMQGEIHLSDCLQRTSLCTSGSAAVCKVHRALALVQANLQRNLKALNFGNL